jgi:hypothetical protein
MIEFWIGILSSCTLALFLLPSIRPFISRSCVFVALLITCCSIVFGDAFYLLELVANRLCTMDVLLQSSSTGSNVSLCLLIFFSLPIYLISSLLDSMQINVDLQAPTR